MFSKKEKAVLESKNVVNEIAQSIWNYGMKTSVFPVAEESGSFLSRDKRNILTFNIGGKKKEFEVARCIFDIFDEGDKGILEYSGNTFISFNRNV